MEINLTKDIDLTIPFSPDAVILARLTVSAIAGKLGFVIDEVEDIKVVVSEVCNMIVTKCKGLQDRCVIRFNMDKSKLEIMFKFENIKPKEFELFSNEDLLALSIVNSLVDKVNTNYFDEDNNIITLTVFKKGS